MTQMMYRFALLLTVPLIALSAQAAPTAQTPQPPQLPPSFKGVLEAYNTVAVLNESAQQLRKDHADRAADITAAQASFEAKFPHIKETLEALITKVAGPDVIPVIKAKVASGFQQNYATYKQKPGVVDDFITRSHALATGQVDGIGQQYILYTQFHDHPEQEMTQGFIHHYQTEGVETAKGINLTLDLPQTWVFQPKKTTDIMLVWRGENGNGSDAITLDARAATDFQPTPAAFISRLKAEDHSLPPNKVQFLTSGSVTIAGHPGFWVKAIKPMPDKTPPFNLGMLIYGFYEKGRIVTIACDSINRPDQSTADTTAHLDRLQPLCQMVAQSIKLQ
jgi:hypothetical protein